MDIKSLINNLRRALLINGYGLRDKARATGNLMIELRGPDGELKEVREIPNLVVDDGLEHIADQLADTPAQSAMSHMAIGSGTTAAAAGDSALETELGRVALTSKTQSTVTCVYVATFPAGTGTGAVTEAGILNNSSGGVLLCRSVFAVVNKAAADALTITWTLTFSAA
jgi:hypothetical protein